MKADAREREATAGDRGLRIAIVAHLAWGAMSGGSRGHVGGVERQTTLLARWLASRGHDVSLLTWDEGQADGVRVDGVRVLALCRRDAGIPGLRFFHPRWTSLRAALARSEADVLYHNCAEYVTGQVALWARGHGRRFVYSVASDMDCDPALPDLGSLRERLLYRYGLKRADRVVVQTLAQARMLERGFDRPSVHIPMPCAGPATLVPRGLPEAPRVLWVGRITEVKRPDRLLEVAGACPEVHFDLVGPGDDPYAAHIRERAAGMDNVAVHPPAAREEIGRYYERGALLLCTSDREGFPNTFLEAWSHGLPVVSTVDPDGLIAGRGLGAVGGDVGTLASALRDLLSASERWRAASAAARRYWKENHDAEVVLARFERLFGEVAGGPGARAA